jgi:hypothetical protein
MLLSESILTRNWDDLCTMVILGPFNIFFSSFRFFFRRRRESSLSSSLLYVRRFCRRSSLRRFFFFFLFRRDSSRLESESESSSSWYGIRFLGRSSLMLPCLCWWCLLCPDNHATLFLNLKRNLKMLAIIIMSTLILMSDSGYCRVILKGLNLPKPVQASVTRLRGLRQ